MAYSNYANFVGRGGSRLRTFTRDRARPVGGTEPPAPPAPPSTGDGLALRGGARLFLRSGDHLKLRSQ